LSESGVIAEQNYRVSSLWSKITRSLRCII